MAIASVARQSTIKEDRSLRDSMQIVNKQKQAAKTLELQAQKLESDQKAAKDKGDIAKQKMLMDTPSPDLMPQAEAFEGMMAQANQDIFDPTLTNQEQLASIGKVHRYSEMSGALFNEVTKSTATFAGTEELRRTHNKAKVAEYQNKYLRNEDGTPRDPTKMDKDGLIPYIANQADIYNVGELMDDYLSTVKENVRTNVSSKKIAGSMFSKNEIETESSRFLKIDPATGTYAKDENGEPTIIISPEQTEAFYNSSKGLQVNVDKYIKDHTVRIPNSSLVNFEGTGKTVSKYTKPSKMDAMEALLKEGGKFQTERQTETKITATPQPKKDPSDPNALSASQKQIAANTEARVSIISKSINAEGDAKGSTLMSTLRNTRGVIKVQEIDGVKKETGVTNIEGGQKYTVIVDPSKTDIVPYLTQSGIRVKKLEGKDQKYTLYEVDVMDNDPLDGLIQLNALIDGSVDANKRTGSDAFTIAMEKEIEAVAAKKAEKTAAAEAKKAEEAAEAKKAAEAEDPFKGGLVNKKEGDVDPNDPFGGGLTGSN